MGRRNTHIDTPQVACHSCLIFGNHTLSPPALSEADYQAKQHLIRHRWVCLLKARRPIHVQIHLRKKYLLVASVWT